MHIIVKSMIADEKINMVIAIRLQDLDAVEALIQGLVLFQGGVLMVCNCQLLSFISFSVKSPNFIDHGSCFFHSCTQVSHDEHLISGSVGELWAVSEGKVTPFPGSFQDYKKLLKSFV